jgi:hypothetical protein
MDEMLAEDAPIEPIRIVDAPIELVCNWPAVMDVTNSEEVTRFALRAVEIVAFEDCIFMEESDVVLELMAPIFRLVIYCGFIDESVIFVI